MTAPAPDDPEMGRAYWMQLVADLACIGAALPSWDQHTPEQQHCVCQVARQVYASRQAGEPAAPPQQQEQPS